MDSQSRAYRADDAERRDDLAALRQERYGEPPAKAPPLEIRELPGSDCVAIRRDAGVDWKVVWLPRSREAQLREQEDKASRQFRAELNGWLTEDGAGGP